MAIGEHTDWTDQELDLIVADYFSMLVSEISRIGYDKTQHRRAAYEPDRSEQWLHRI
jgi:hypothetical protein